MAAKGLGVHAFDESLLAIPLVEKLLQMGVKKDDIFLLRKKFSQAAAADDGEDTIEDVVPDAEATGAADTLYLDIDGAGAAGDAAAGIGCRSLKVHYVDSSGYFKNKDVVPTGATGKACGITDFAYPNTIEGVVFGTSGKFVGDNIEIGTDDDLSDGDVYLSLKVATNAGILDGTCKFYVGAYGGAAIVYLHPHATTHDVYLRVYFMDLAGTSGSRGEIQVIEEPIKADTKDADMEHFEVANYCHPVLIPPETRMRMTVQNLTAAEDGVIEGYMEILYWTRPKKLYTVVSA